MGLTIGWSLALPGELDFRACRGRVEALRACCTGLPIEAVDPQVDVLEPAPEADGTSDRAQRFSWAGLSFAVPGAPRGTYTHVEATAAAGFQIYLGPGGETAYFGVARLPHERPWPSTPAPGNASRLLGVPRHRGRWYGEGECKTQYTGHPRHGGPENFLRRHLALIATLDWAATAGFDVDVWDDGEYWNRRDVGALLDALHAHDRQIARFVGRFKDALAGHAGGVLGAPVAGRPDFERLEAGVVGPRPSGPWPTDVEGLIALTARSR